MLDVGFALGIEIKGGRNHNLKKIVEMQEKELREMIYALDDFDEESILEDDVDLENDASLSLFGLFILSSGCFASSGFARLILVWALLLVEVFRCLREIAV
ncbi:hypothetical protein RHMOL_Rhmol07G0212000 [Rhododendron molle]|uniref:Uncharacterized protein n=1 Tax=Rhododendron molle TaxID=49168 RepID=A0ACC0N324_RHOML|nr:hypothetical protein RHMOL_Rhmol07G0212000 [Rhododendron molle]